MLIVQFILAGFCISMASYGQSITIGIKGGARLTKDLHESVGMVSESRSYTIGPTVDIGLWRGFGMEFDVLYKRVGKSEVGRFLGTYSWSRDRSNSFEFPILAKYRLSSKQPGPYFSGGYAFRQISGSGTVNWINAYYGPPQFGEGPYTPHYGNSSGLVVGGGVEFGLCHMKVSPEFRYTRWFNGGLRSTYDYTISAQNQAEILVGIGWLARSR